MFENRINNNKKKYFFSYGRSLVRIIIGNFRFYTYSIGYRFSRLILLLKLIFWLFLLISNFYIDNARRVFIFNRRESIKNFFKNQIPLRFF